MTQLGNTTPMRMALGTTGRVRASTALRAASAIIVDDACDAPTKRPRGRPPFGAVLAPDGTYHLPAEAIEAAAERVVRHRKACREQYAATRQGLQAAKPELFKNRKPDRRQYTFLKDDID